MKPNEIQAFLERYLHMDQRIDRLCEIQATWRACAVRIPGLTGQALRHYRATEAEINREIDELLTIKQEIEEAVRTTPGRKSQELLERHYLFGETWEIIAERLQLSLQETALLHERALAGIRVPEEQERKQMRSNKEQKFAIGGEEHIRREHCTIPSGDCCRERPSCSAPGGRRLHNATAPNTQ